MLTCPSRRQTADFFYIMMKYCDWLVIGGVTGCGRHEEWFAYRRHFFHVLSPPHASLSPAGCKKIASVLRLLRGWELREMGNKFCNTAQFFAIEKAHRGVRKYSYLPQRGMFCVGVCACVTPEPKYHKLNIYNGDREIGQPKVWLPYLSSPLWLLWAAETLFILNIIL